MGYDQVTSDYAAEWRTTHKNDERTMVAVLDVIGESYVVIAVDLDASGEVLTSEIVDDALTQAEAEARARRWMGENEKGVAGGGFNLLG